jgi:hypothetical protein
MDEIALVDLFIQANMPGHYDDRPRHHPAVPAPGEIELSASFVPHTRRQRTSSIG